jgi:hypothetical protein
MNFTRSPRDGEISATNSSAPYHSETLFDIPVALQNQMA